MNEEPTEDLPERRSFEDRVFARFDAMDARFDGVETRLEKLESRSYDTKPIWEKALRAIMDTRAEVVEVKNRVIIVETAVGGLAGSVTELKTDVAGLKSNYGSLRNEFVDIRRELRENVRQELTLILKFLIEGRQDIRDAEDRIRRLETKLA